MQFLSRFYFVGDEDLLEIMGNSKDTARLQKHLKKMFAGVTAIDVREEDRVITAMHSREGETVELVKPVETKDKKINDWLRDFEAEMRHTLARFVSYRSNEVIVRVLKSTLRETRV